MINQTVKLFLVAVLLLLAGNAFALPGKHDPLSGGRGYQCNDCHWPGKTTGKNDATYALNICLTCHMDSAETSKLFPINDFANPYKNSTVNQPSPKATSHKWFGTDTVPAAGALPPIDTRASGLNKTGFAGYLSCARCHSVHGTSGEDSVKAPYLRMQNDQDQMCRNCHRTRDVLSHTAGSHPVNISYTSASAKAKVVAGTLLSTPAQVQTAIAGKYSKVKLVNGMIVCSTCHGTHGTDSRSSTFDIVTSTTFRPLSTSKGYLLRVDARGKTANALNICTNCHTGKTAHNNKGQNVQCNDCHSGHVEYDAAAVPDGDARPNSFLIRRYLQYSSTTVPRISKRQFFRYTGATTKEYYNTTAGMYGVCQTCHYPKVANPDTHYNVAGNPASGLNGGHQPNQCNSCHFHGAVNGSFSYEAAVGSCITTCHGFPPHLNTAGTDGEAGTGEYTRYDEATTPHASHALGGASYYKFDCDQCHRGASMSNGLQGANGNFVEVFKTHTGAAGINGGYIYAGKIASYTTASGTCNNVYCHSNGKGGYKTGQKNILWGDGTPTPGLNSIMGLAPATRCATCHSTATTFHNASTGHYRHVSATAMNYGCQICHSNTVTDNTTLNPVAMTQNGVHVNGVKDFVFNQGANPPAIGSTCETVACHSNGKGAAPVITPQWRVASTGACGACHRTKAFGNLSTGGHRSTAHMTLDTHCSRCHTSYSGEISANHVNGTLEAPAGCSINACHGTITAPTWTATYAGKDTCTKCHGTLTNTGVITPAAENRYLVAPSDAGATDTGQVSTNAKIGAHQTHMRYFNGFTNYSTVDYYCQACHGTLPGVGTHADGISSPNTKFQTLASNWGARTGGTAPTFTGTTCSNTYCHNPAGAGGTLDALDNGSDPAPDWNQPAYLDDGGKNQANCGKCHKVPGDIGFQKQSAHGANVTNSGYNCAGCHGHNGDQAGALGQRHMDGKYYANGACDSCHGYPPVANMTGLGIVGNFENAKIETLNGGYAGGGGYHTKHLLATVTAGEGFTPCLPCHPQTSHQQDGTVIRANVQVNDAADTGYRFDSTRSKRYNSTAWTCSNVSCHFRPTPAWNL